ncbi:hypothetical protein L596_012088 [Steinernema carpocapsae]|uniref:RRM domain-containing protein n=1 Tax=Steinernema carpocapsae TaxID=34508 RepID=A0A4U5NW88_STECR|nr:hypothetical protein L596_012088 [Steinernema carpocapsae]
MNATLPSHAHVAQIDSLTVPAVDFDPQKNVYVKNFGYDFSDAELRMLFENFGEIASCVVAKNPEGKSKGFGFVAFKNRSSAQAAIQMMHQAYIKNGRILFVAQFQKKEDRCAMLARQRKAKSEVPQAN